MQFRQWLSSEKNDLLKRIKSYPRYRLVFFIVVVLGFLWANFWLWQKTYSSWIFLVDNFVIAQSVNFRETPLKNIFSLITVFGSGYFIAFLSLALVVLLVLKRRKRAAFVVLFSLLGSYFFVHIFKNYFGRERPFGCDISSDCYSFPSGHTTISYYFYGLIDYFAFRFLPISFRRFLFLTILLAVLIVLVALSRVVLLVHYPSDILAGFFLGNAWLLLAVFLIDLLYR